MRSSVEAKVSREPRTCCVRHQFVPRYVREPYCTVRSSLSGGNHPDTSLNRTRAVRRRLQAQARGRARKAGSEQADREARSAQREASEAGTVGDPTVGGAASGRKAAGTSGERSRSRGALAVAATELQLKKSLGFFRIPSQECSSGTERCQRLRTLPDHIAVGQSLTSLNRQPQRSAASRTSSRRSVAASRSSSRCSRASGPSSSSSSSSSNSNSSSSSSSSSSSPHLWTKPRCSQDADPSVSAASSLPGPCRLGPPSRDSKISPSSFVVTARVENCFSARIVRQFFPRAEAMHRQLR